MRTRVIMPKLGLTMEEGMIVSWLRGVGDRIAEGQPLLEIETDKVIQEVVAEVSGTLVEIVRSEGDTVPVSETLGFVETPEPDTEHPDTANDPEPSRLDRLIARSRTRGGGEAVTEASQQPAAERTRPPSSPRIKASHRARHAAAARGLDLSRLPPGSGPGGRIVERDVVAWADASRSESQREARRLDAIQRVVAERTTSSFSKIPHFYLSTEVAADRLLSLRRTLLPGIKQRHNVRLTITDLILKAAAEALTRHPLVNARWTDSGIEPLREVNLGLAVDGARGLMVPVITGADRKTIAQIALERSALVEKALRGTLSRSDLSGGSFTISNLGMFGVDRFQAVINPPQSAILAVGAIKERPVALEGRLLVRPTVVLTLSVDHRVVGGAESARFLGELTGLIEDPDGLDAGGIVEGTTPEA